MQLDQASNGSSWSQGHTFVEQSCMNVWSAMFQPTQYINITQTESKLQSLQMDPLAVCIAQNKASEKVVSELFRKKSRHENTG